MSDNIAPYVIEGRESLLAGMTYDARRYSLIPTSIYVYGEDSDTTAIAEFHSWCIKNNVHPNNYRLIKQKIVREAVKLEV